MMSVPRSATEIAETWNLKDACRTLRRFWAKVKIDRENPKACWNWTKAINTYGYGVCVCQGRTIQAQRIAWLLSRGAIPAGLGVLHHCDNRMCCNPSHLFLGTSQDNLRDKVSKGRQAKGDRVGSRAKPWTRPRGENHYFHKHPERLRGENNGRAVLTQVDADEIRRKFNSGESTTKQLAMEYGLNRYYIYSILKRKTWNYPPG